MTSKQKHPVDHESEVSHMCLRTVLNKSPVWSAETAWEKNLLIFINSVKKKYLTSLNIHSRVSIQMSCHSVMPVSEAGLLVPSGKVGNVLGDVCFGVQNQTLLDLAAYF